MTDETQTTGVQDAPTADDSQAVDTAPSQASEADVQVKNEAPEAAQDTEENTSSESKAEDTAEERLLAGKYKSVEDLEKSYQELQSKATRDAQEKAELARILNESVTAPETPQANSDTAVYDDYQEADPVAQKVEALERSQTVQNFIFTHPDADGKSMNEVLTSDPFAKTISDINTRLEYAYLKSKDMTSNQAVEEARKTAIVETKQKTVEKQTAQVEAAQKAETVSEKDELKHKATTGSPDERAKARLDYIRKFMV